MKSYEFLPHVADVRLKVKADNLEDLFSAALQGMASLIKNNSCPFDEELEEDSIIKETIEISSIDSTSLLIDFLSEILTHSQVNKAVYCKVKFEKLTDNFLKAIIFGTKINSFDEDIKAVTHHEAEIKKDSDGNFETIIIFDI